MEKIDLIRSRILKPIGCRPLRELARGSRNVLIVTDDNTRLTPLRHIVPMVLEELRYAGIAGRQIKILIASGTHRPMTPGELSDKFGAKIMRGFKIYSHRWDNSSFLAKINSRVAGKKIYINRLAKDSDFIIGIGSIVPHATTGFSGGGKIILPGICGKDTVEEMHWMALDFQIKDILGKYRNPMREMVDSVALKTGLKFIVNAVIGKDCKFLDLVAGHPVKAHKSGVELARKAFGVRFERSADIVVADARPMDIDLRQAIKAVAAAGLVVRKGGIIILVAQCPEGVSPQFPEFQKYGFKDPEGLKKQVEKGRVRSKLMAYTLIVIGRILKYKARVILVSQGISADTAENLGFLWAVSLKDALAMARKLIGKKARVARLNRACEALPLLN